MSYRFAIVGCGRIAARHAEQIQTAARLVAVCDTDRQKATAFGLQYHAAAYGSPDDLLKAEKPDVVVICTPNGLHARHAIQALEAGCDVLCEKPLSITVADGEAMIRAAALAKKRLFVVKQNRFNPPVVAVRQLLDQGRLGKIHSFQINCFWNRPAGYYRDTWRGTRLLDGGTLCTQFSHFIDLLYWFLGDLSQASGWRGNFQHRDSIEFEDTGVAQLIMASGAIGSLNYTINAHAGNMEGSFTLFGETGTVKIGGAYLNQMEYFSVEGMQPPPMPAPVHANNYGFYQGSMSNHPIVYRELIKTLDNPALPFLEASEALRSVEMIARIYAASPFIEALPDA